MKTVTLTEHDTGCQMSSFILFAAFNPLNTKLNTICHLLALLGARPILHVSRIRVNQGIIRHDKCLACYTRVEPWKRNNFNNVFVYVQCLLLVSNF